MDNNQGSGLKLRGSTIYKYLVCPDPPRLRRVQRQPSTEAATSHITPETSPARSHDHGDSPKFGGSLHDDPFQMEDFECSVCSCLFTDPRILPCRHTLCFNCLTKLFETFPDKPAKPDPAVDKVEVHQQAEDVAGDDAACASKISQDDSPSADSKSAKAHEGESASQTSVRCPLCREEIVLPEQGLQGLPVNYDLKIKLEQAMRRLSKTEMTICTDSDDEAVSDSLDGRSYHGRIHCDPPLEMCSRTQDHLKPKPLEFYCRTCEEPACEVCVILHHRSEQHNVVSLSSWGKERREQLLSLVDMRSEYEARLGQALKDIDTANLRSEHEALHRQASVESAAERLKREVDRRRDALINESDALRKAEANLLRGKREELGSKLRASVETRVEIARRVYEASDVELMTMNLEDLQKTTLGSIDLHQVLTFSHELGDVSIAYDIGQFGREQEEGWRKQRLVVLGVEKTSEVIKEKETRERRATNTRNTPRQAKRSARVRRPSEKAKQVMLEQKKKREKQHEKLRQ